MFRSEAFSGPLPSPDTLAKYDEIVPGMADRLLTKFEQQTDHRMGLENRVVDGDIRRANLGTRLGFVFGLAVLAAAVYLIINGHEGPGVLALISDFLAYGAAYLYGDISKRRERNQKAQGR